MSAAAPSDPTSRTALGRRLTTAMADHHGATPWAVIDLEAFDANAADLARRAAGKPIRVASKSLRVPSLISRALAHPGFAGVLGFTVREALWLVAQGITDDVLVAYPSTDRSAIERLAADETARQAITLMVDDETHLDLIRSTTTPATPIRVAIDVDAGWRAGPLLLGPKRSPLRDLDQILVLARLIAADPRLNLVGLMTYEGQVAGVQDRPTSRRPDQVLRAAAVGGIKRRSMTQLAQRREAIDDAVRSIADLEFFNAGGSGSIEVSGADPAVTELSAGSGLLVPTLFDHYRSFRPRPAAFYGIPVVRVPGPGLVTVAGGGFLASGPAAADRAPTPWSPPSLALTGLEGAGEVQTPLTGPGTAGLQVGDIVWFRHAKSGELFEHVHEAHLIDGSRLHATVPTYRGCGAPW